MTRRGSPGSVIWHTAACPPDIWEMDDKTRFEELVRSTEAPLRRYIAGIGLGDVIAVRETEIGRLHSGEVVTKSRVQLAVEIWPRIVFPGSDSQHVICKISIQEEFKQSWSRWTPPLYSPPYLPSYNGACEAGNGVIKHLAHDLACRNGRPGRWTLDDLEGARLLTNRRITDRTQTRSPEQRFAERLLTTDADRDKLAVAVRTARRLRCAQLAIASDNQPRSITADALERQAIADALLDIGILTIRRCRVRLPNQEH